MQFETDVPFVRWEGWEQKQTTLYCEMTACIHLSLICITSTRTVYQQHLGVIKWRHEHVIEGGTHESKMVKRGFVVLEISAVLVGVSGSSREGRKGEDAHLVVRSKASETKAFG